MKERKHAENETVYKKWQNVNVPMEQAVPGLRGRVKETHVLQNGVYTSTNESIDH